MGVFAKAEFDEAEQTFTPGDRMFLFTDGVIEPLGGPRRSRAKGLDNLVETCRRVAGLPIDVAVPEVLVQAFCGGEDVDDDFVLLGVEL